MRHQGQLHGRAARTAVTAMTEQSLRHAVKEATAAMKVIGTWVQPNTVVS